MQTFVLSIGGKIIQVAIEQGGNPFYHTEFISILKTQYEGFILKNHAPLTDFTIRIKKYDSVNFIPKRLNLSKEVFLTPVATWNFKQKYVEIPFHISRAQFEVVVKTILMHNSTNNEFLFLHASSVLYKGKVHIFFALPGGGKSTIAHQLSTHKGIRQFSDDLCLIRFKNKTIKAYYHPFIETNWSYSRTYRDFPLSCCYIIGKGEKFSYTPLFSKVETLEVLLQQSISKNEQFSKQELSQIDTLHTVIPFKKISFTLNSKETFKGFLRITGRL